jgi:2-keto-4-pentenoate hydratase
MGGVDPRLSAALEAQLRRRPAHAERVGWKLGVGDRERIGDEVAVGHLTPATLLEPGAIYEPSDGELLHADVELAVELGADGAIVGYGVALELVDLRSPPDTPEDVVVANVFHRAVAFGPPRPDAPPRLEARAFVDGGLREAATTRLDMKERLRAAARVLASVGERLEEGDRVITGSIVQIPVERGEQVEADLGVLGRVRLHVAAAS